MGIIDKTEQFNIDVYVKVLGGRRITPEEMLAEAQEVWKEQPRCSVFLKGFTAYIDRDGNFVCSQDTKNYNREVAADYLVLEHVSNNWDNYKQSEFENELVRMWDMREGIGYVVKYEPGDYSEAALTLIEKLASSPNPKGEA